MTGRCSSGSARLRRGLATAGLAQKSVRELATQATGEDRGDSPFLSSLINHGGPLHPERFPTVLATKGFTVKADRARICELYRAVAQAVLSTMSHTSFSHCRWAEDDFANCGYTLKLCGELAGMRLNNVGLDASCLRALLQKMDGRDLPMLSELHLKDNPLGDDGLHELAAALQHGLLPALKYIVMRKNDETELGRAALEAACNTREPPISINRAEKNNKKVEETAHSKERKSRQGKQLQMRRGTVALTGSHNRLGSALKVGMLVNHVRHISTGQASQTDLATKGGSSTSVFSSAKFSVCELHADDRRSSNAPMVSAPAEAPPAEDDAVQEKHTKRGGERGTVAWYGQ